MPEDKDLPCTGHAILRQKTHSAAAGGIAFNKGMVDGFAINPNRVYEIDRVNFGYTKRGTIYRLVTDEGGWWVDGQDIILIDGGVPCDTQS